MPLIIQSSKCATPQLRHHSITNRKLIDKMPGILEKYFSGIGKGDIGEPEDQGNENLKTSSPPTSSLLAPSGDQAPVLISTKSDQNQTLLNLA
jgi:hypothetical protein